MGEAAAIEKSAIGTAEIFNLDVFAVQDEPAMFAGDVAERNSQVAVFATTDDRHVAGNGKTPALPIRPEHDHHNAHVQPASRVRPLEPATCQPGSPARAVPAMKLLQRGGLQWRPTRFKRCLQRPIML